MNTNQEIQNEIIELVDENNSIQFKIDELEEEMEANARFIKKLKLKLQITNQESFNKSIEELSQEKLSGAEQEFIQKIKIEPEILTENIHITRLKEICINHTINLE